MKKTMKAIFIAAICCLMSNFAGAQLLGVSPAYPQINFFNSDIGAISYTATNGMFTLTAPPDDIVFSDQDSGTLIVSNRNLSVQLNTDGTLLSGTNGFELDGTYTNVTSGVTTVYSGVLLKGDVIAFGYLAGTGSAQFDFRIQLTGGQIQSFFNCATLFDITLSSETSDFTGSFTNDFDGSAKGECGPENNVPPTITCPLPSQVVTTPATDPNNPTNSGFIITYPDPTVTDNCDPFPTIFSDTPSGSFVPLNPGDSLTVNSFAFDVSGNLSTCSFTVIMGQNSQVGMPCIAFTNSCPPVTLSNTPGQCSATYIFSLPEATNCNGQVFTSTATAVNEAGTAITLTTLSNGMVEGVFPRTLTTNGDVITFTVNDGHGDTAVMSCHVFVDDTQPSTIMCLNQTATFKPILTNALSCNQACFNTAGINAGDTLWFTSAIENTTPCRNNNGQFTVHVFNQTIDLAVDDTNITLTVPDAYIYYSNGVSVATTVFTNNEWVTTVNSGYNGRVFAAGLSWQVPFNLNNSFGGRWGRDQDDGHLCRRVKSATWCGRFAVDTAGVALQWQWGAVVEHCATNPVALANCNALGVKPVDDDRSSCWKNSDPCGACENFKSCLVKGGCGNGWYQQGRGGSQCDCTGVQSPWERCNLGKGIVCEGAVEFNPPVATDNCGGTVKVTCNPAPGSLFGPGNYTINCTAVDTSGNSNECSFTLTVLAPLQVVFDSPSCDNIADNTSEPDAGFTDFNCPDDPSTPAFINCFHPGDRICHVVRLLDCNGNDVTSSLSGCVTVHIDVTERQGTFSSSVLVNNVPQNYTSIGSPGCLLVPINGTYQYCLDTTGYQAGTINTTRFFRSCVWVEYNSSPCIPVGMEDVILESQ